MTSRNEKIHCIWYCCMHLPSFFLARFTYVNDNFFLVFYAQSEGCSLENSTNFLKILLKAFYYQSIKMKTNKICNSLYCKFFGLAALKTLLWVCSNNTPYIHKGMVWSQVIIFRGKMPTFLFITIEH